MIFTDSTEMRLGLLLLVRQAVQTNLRFGGPNITLPQLKHTTYLLKSLLAQPRGGTDIAIIAAPSHLKPRTLSVPFKALDKSRIYLDLNIFLKYRPTENKYLDKYIELLEEDYNIPVQPQKLPKWISPSWVHGSKSSRRRFKMPQIYTEQITANGSRPIYISFIDNYRISNFN
ncbi:uncharacterized protein [Rhodnius prolixus]|uniref:uncharacterized protein n=1 Tax=Rhodnius prolixus TaxID=13249 RepID=UPI003D1887AC